tara:strand:+ start:5547 stop:5735 length:189 start_codon:yes stop_codon:yes gene_type:complete
MTELQEARRNGFHSAKEEEFTKRCICCLWWYDPKNLLDNGLCSNECPEECEDEENFRHLKEL